MQHTKNTIDTMIRHFNNLEKGAILSVDKKYRYQLWRIWDNNKKIIAFIGLNPSTADDKIDDPTITRCIDFAKNWGYGGFYMVNLFAFRATNPNELKNQEDSVGTENDKHLQEVFDKVEVVVCVWGNRGKLKKRNVEVLKLIKQPFCIKKNFNGEPAHPLYIKKELKPTPLN